MVEIEQLIFSPEELSNYRKGVSMKSIIYEPLQNYSSLFVVILLYFLILTSCSKTIYKYNNIEYESQEAALAAAEKDFVLLLNKIEPTETPVGGSIRAIIPSDSYIEKNFITSKGPELSGKDRIDSTKYIIAGLKNHFLRDIRGIERRGIFSTVFTSQSDDPEIEPFNEDFAIVLSRKDRNPQWFLRKKNQSEELIPIPGISTSLPPLLQATLWLDGVEKVASGK